MLNQTGFIDCITEQLTARGFGAGVTNAYVARYKRLEAGHAAAGLNPTDAAVLAASDLFRQLSEEKKEQAKRLLKTLAVQASNNERIASAASVELSRLALDGKTSRGAAFARAAISLIEDDPRFPGMSYSTRKEVVRGQLWAIFGDVLDKLGKGAFGVQRGSAHMPNVVRELFGENTGDVLASQFARAYAKAQDVALDLFNGVGGSMRKLADYHLPQAHNTAKLVRAGEQAFVDFHMNALDWGKMRHADGTPIAAAERDKYLRDVYKVQSTDGAINADVNARGRGHSVGNALDKHRQLVYKDAASWLGAHEQFGDGNVFEVVAGHMEDFAHKIALVETFGPNPELAAQNIHAVVRKHAAQHGGNAVADADNVMKNTFQPMLDVVLRANPIDPHDKMGAAVMGLGNMLTAAQLGSAVVPAVLGDAAQSGLVRLFNKMPLFGGMDFYFKTLATDKTFMRKIAAQSGFVMDDVVASTYAASRFSGVATYGPAVTRHVSEGVMRASLLSGHTNAARWANQAEFMGLMARDAGKAFDKLEWRAVAERYGITAQDWDAFRQTAVYSPRKDVNFLRPIDVLQSNTPGADLLYRKMQGMVFEESRRMVPESTIEGSVYLRDTTRPDTLRGAILHSFSMYKNFPVSFLMVYGRLALTSPTTTGKLAFAGGLIAAMTAVGALSTQMREVSKGRDPLPMNDPKFWAKSFMAGGAMSIYGDFLFSGVNSYGSGPADVVAGPVWGFVKDATQLGLGEAFERIGDGDTDGMGGPTAARAVEMLRRYTPGSSLWYARVALDRIVFDKLQELADPDAYRKQRAKARKQEETYGNEYWWEPGATLPSRAPKYESAQ